MLFLDSVGWRWVVLGPQEPVRPFPAEPGQGPASTAGAGEAVFVEDVGGETPCSSSALLSHFKI